MRTKRRNWLDDDSFDVSLYSLLFELLSDEIDDQESRQMTDTAHSFILTKHETNGINLAFHFRITKNATKDRESLR